MLTKIRDKIIEGTKHTQTGAILAAALGVERPEPYYSGKASITSDGYIMCNFVGTDGQHHMGAFVGSVGELEQNLRRVKDHFSLTDEQFDELENAVFGQWVAVDYR